MIDFPCHHCAFKFSVPADLAGGTIQCPECGFLADVPTHGDREAILPDGTYRMDAPEAPAADGLAKAMYAFNRDSLDDEGNEKDLRTTMQEVRRAGAPAVSSEVQPLQIAPKYDPETGELIRPLIVAPREQDAEDIPLAKTAIGYAVPGTYPHVSPGRVFLELFAPMNAFVMMFIFGFHILLQVTIITLNVLFPIVVFGFLVMAIIAHYGCVVEDVGRDEIDELPRPLRSLSMYEDLWLPFGNVFFALMICYGPAIAVFFGVESIRLQLFLGYSLLTLGTILLPAVALTTLTSGTIDNLRPDRLLGVIRAAGGRYPLLVIGWIIAMPIYIAGVWALNRAGSGSLFSGMGVSGRFWAMAMLLLMAGIYLMHAWCWQLALFYRAKNAAFPWAFQRHERTKRPERMRGRHLRSSTGLGRK